MFAKSVKSLLTTTVRIPPGGYKLRLSPVDFSGLPLPQWLPNASIFEAEDQGWLTGCFATCRNCRDR